MKESQDSFGKAKKTVVTEILLTKTCLGGCNFPRKRPVTGGKTTTEKANGIRSYARAERLNAVNQGRAEWISRPDADEVFRNESWYLDGMV